MIECIEKTMDKLKDIGLSKSDIKAIGITNQRETTLVWDKETGEPLHNAIGNFQYLNNILYYFKFQKCLFIVWLDMRTTTTLDDVLDTIPNKSRNKNYLKPLCGLPMSPYFSALKIRWLIDNVPRVKQAVKDERCAFGTVDTWLIWVKFISPIDYCKFGA